MLGDVGQCWVQRLTNTNPLFQPVAWKCCLLCTAIVSPSFFYFSFFPARAVFVFFTLVNSFLSWSKLWWNELSPQLLNLRTKTYKTSSVEHGHTNIYFIWCYQKVIGVFVNNSSPLLSLVKGYSWYCANKSLLQREWMWAGVIQPWTFTKYGKPAKYL